MHMPWVEILAVMRHVALTERIAIGKHVQICFCCPRLAFVHKRNCLCLYWVCRRSVSAKYLLRYESRADSIAVTGVTELVWSLARHFDKKSHTGFVALLFPCKVERLIHRMNILITKRFSRKFTITYIWWFSRLWCGVIRIVFESSQCHSFHGQRAQMLSTATSTN